jgi:hypothetical protein
VDLSFGAGLADLSFGAGLEVLSFGGTKPVVFNLMVVFLSAYLYTAHNYTENNSIIQKTTHLPNTPQHLAKDHPMLRDAHTLHLPLAEIVPSTRAHLHTYVLA